MGKVYHSTLLGTVKTKSIPVVTKTTAGKPTGTSQEAKGMNIEINVLKKLSTCANQNVVVFIQEWLDPKQFGYVMPAYTGGDLWKHAGPTSGWTVRRRLLIVRDLFTALVCIHGHGIAHNDIKPGNVMLESSDEDAPAILIDFGTAYDQHDQSLRPLKSVGCSSMAYLAPECTKSGQPDPFQVDMYLAGIVMYAMVMFQNEGQVESLTKFGEFDWAKHVTEDANFGTHTSPGYTRLCISLLAVDPTHRPTAEQALKTVEKLLRELSEKK